MAQNEMKAMRDMPWRVRSTDGLGAATEALQRAAIVGNCGASPDMMADKLFMNYDALHPVATCRMDNSCFD